MERRIFLRSLATLMLIGMISSCEEDLTTIKAVNHWDRIVIFSVDGYEVARLQPLTNKEFDVKEGTHTVTLALEDGTLLFEQSIHIESMQFVSYHVQSDGSVLASGGDDDPTT